VCHVLGRLQAVEVNCNGQLIALSFSAGWTDFKPGESTEDLLKRADDALYVNKRAGRVHEVVEASGT
jgi:PleD family two-component response regulator